MPTAATVYISETNGAGAVTDNIGNFNFGSVDQPNIVAANHPVLIGNYSYEKYFRFKVQSLGDSTSIQDLRFWKSSGAYVTGEGLRFVCSKYNTNDAITYAAPVEGESANGGVPTIWQDLPTADPGSVMPSIGGVRPGKFPDNAAVPGYCDYSVIVTNSTVSTPVGPANSKVFTFQYSET